MKIGMKSIGLTAAALAVVGGLALTPYVYAESTAGHAGSQQASCRPSLPDDKRQMLHDAMKAAHEKDKALYEEAHKLKHELKDTMTASSFDQKTFTTLSARLGDVRAHIRKDRTAALVPVLAKFSPDEREEFVHMMHRHHRHGGWGHKKRSQERDGNEGQGDNQANPAGPSPDMPPSQ